MALSPGQLLVGKDAFGQQVLTKPSQGFSRLSGYVSRFTSSRVTRTNAVSLVVLSW